MTFIVTKLFKSSMNILDIIKSYINQLNSILRETRMSLPPSFWKPVYITTSSKIQVSKNSIKVR